MKKITLFILSVATILTQTAQAKPSHHKPFKKKKPEYTRAWTSPVKECNNKQKFPEGIYSCFTQRDKANHAFQMVHRNSKGVSYRTKYVALLLHGLSDSPYFYRDIAIALFKQGINVIGLRWTGMGTKAKDLADVHRNRWYEDLEWGKNLAEKFSSTGSIILGGMSLGGTMIAHDTVTKVDPRIKGALLFSPAIGLMPKIRKACLPIIVGLYGAKKAYGTGVRYPKISNNGTCQLTKVVDDMLEDALEKRYKPKEVSKYDNGLNLDMYELYKNVNFPIFNVITGWDSAIDFELTLGYSTHSQSNLDGKSKMVYYYNPKEDKPFPEILPEKTIKVKAKNELKHASTLLRKDKHLLTDPEFNPYYNSLERELIKFTKKYFK